MTRVNVQGSSVWSSKYPQTQRNLRKLPRVRHGEQCEPSRCPRKFERNNGFFTCLSEAENYSYQRSERIHHRQGALSELQPFFKRRHLLISAPNIETHYASSRATELHSRESYESHCRSHPCHIVRGKAKQLSVNRMHTKED